MAVTVPESAGWMNRMMAEIWAPFVVPMLLRENLSMWQVRFLAVGGWGRLGGGWRLGCCKPATGATHTVVIGQPWRHTCCVVKHAVAHAVMVDPVVTHAVVKRVTFGIVSAGEGSQHSPQWLGD